MQGFVIFDHMDRYEASVAVLADWVRSGQLVYDEDVLDGMDAAPMRSRGCIAARIRASGSLRFRLILGEAVMLTGKNIVVLGGSSGIGFAVASAALAQGATVHIGSSSADKVEAAVTRLGDGASGSAVDLSDEASIEAFFAPLGPIDHMAYTAGDWTRRRLKIGPEFDAAEAQASFDVRFWGILRSLKFALPLLAADGSVTLTSGLFAHRPAKGSAFRPP